MSNTNKYIPKQSGSKHTMQEDSSTRRAHVHLLCHSRSQNKHDSPRTKRTRQITRGSCQFISLRIAKYRRYPSSVWFDRCGILASLKNERCFSKEAAAEHRLNKRTLRNALSSCLRSLMAEADMCSSRVNICWQQLEITIVRGSELWKSVFEWSSIRTRSTKYGYYITHSCTMACVQYWITTL